MSKKTGIVGVLLILAGIAAMALGDYLWSSHAANAIGGMVALGVLGAIAMAIGVGCVVMWFMTGCATNMRR